MGFNSGFKGLMPRFYSSFVNKAREIYIFFCLGSQTVLMSDKDFIHPNSRLC